MKEKITSVEKAAYKVYSELLQAYLWVADSDEDMKTLRDEGITEAIYTADEIRKLKGMSKDYLREIHKVKAVFPESVIKDIQKPSSFFSTRAKKGK
jgi:hypothetical protein